MAPANILVRAIAPADRADWLDMWNGYCAFYETAVPDRVTARTWRRIVAGDAGLGGLIALDADTRPVGFANYVVHPYTWGEQPCCYLEDLFVRPEARANGIGAALIERLLAFCTNNGWARLYWMTRAGNAAARRLYDRFGTCDDFVRYTVTLLADKADQLLGKRTEIGVPGDV